MAAPEKNHQYRYEFISLTWQIMSLQLECDVDGLANPIDT